MFPNQTAAVVASLLLALAATIRAAWLRYELRTWRTDQVTGLPVRREFYRLARRALRRGHRMVVFVDLDRFKEINNYSYDLGDAFLAVIGRRIRAAGGPNTITGRLGGDEFGLVIDLAAAAHSTPWALLVRLQLAITTPVELDDLVRAADLPGGLTSDKQISVGASIGAVEIPGVRNPSLRGALTMAADLMAETKRAGGGTRLVTADPEDPRLNPDITARPHHRARDLAVPDEESATSTHARDNTSN